MVVGVRVGGTVAVWVSGLGRGQWWILLGLGKGKIVVVAGVRGGGTFAVWMLGLGRGQGWILFGLGVGKVGV